MQVSHRVWIQHNGAGPWPCAQCSDPVTWLGTHRHETSPDRGVIHHHDRNHGNNDPANLRIMHDRCHIEHHDAASRAWPWRRVADDVRERVQVGMLTGQLPTRCELAALYRVSHMTVQRAIDTLKDEGLLHSRPGLGVYVKEQQ